ncbi:uncharacterized protein FOMMEDRAFT_17884 [Fomitiporia mediterranea MF3/22]|uniref:uncharacterized protein n=1 Tax=Fomitiporia mediterranea (strain MF3/22) TaxID=694068 RepID=UPI0004409AC6|nr:uncharacterized protein FOMMEDRAFT_17884 [Fomitiporia mediterranea MF3/22]EJD05614.1 hypothetical protein FOMMEDRAFT_17884 [Fomitiporia mediterranea MF3/22]
MIILPQPDEKSLDGFNTTTQVYYASMPVPRPASAPIQGDINDLSSHLDNSLNIDEQPPAYEDHVPGAQLQANPIPTGDVKDPNVFRDGPGGDENKDDDEPRNARLASSSRDLNTNSAIPGRAPREATFPPLVMHSRSKKLEDGFYAMLPPTDVQPHPFSQRDIRESDWTKFLSDLQTSARLSPESSSSEDRSNFFKTMGSMFRSFSGAPGKQAEQGNHRGPAALVDTWNENFFHRRGLDVVLAKGGRRLNGDRSLPPPDSLPSDGSTNSRSRWTMPLSMPQMTPVHPMPIMPPLPGPLMGHLGGRNPGLHRSKSATSLSSCSSSDSDSDSDFEHDRRHPQRQPQPNTQPLPRSRSFEREPGYSSTYYASKAERHAARKIRRAAHRVHRAERKERKRERRLERKYERFAHKAARWHAFVGGLGAGHGPLGMGPSGSGTGMGMAFGRGMGAGCGRGVGMGWGRGMGMGYGRGMGLGRGGHHMGPWSRSTERGLGFGPGMGFGQSSGEDDGYYRLVVSDLL